MDHRGFDSLADGWRDLLSRSDADPLFNSPEWMSAWQQQYRSVLGGEVEVLAARRGPVLCGVAAMLKRRVRLPGGLGSTRLELLGNAWRSRGTAMSERVEFVLDREHEQAAGEALAAEILADPDWDDLVVAHTEHDGPTARVFAEVAVRGGGYLREPDEMEAWEIPLQGRFDDYAASLGSGTRARMLGSRRRLAEAGDVRERLLTTGQLDEGWQVLDDLYRRRWNRPLGWHWREFYSDVADRLAGQPGAAVISVLEFNGKPLSAMLNFRAGCREYSILSAFAATDVKRVSPGWLHLGIAIERACADGMEVFDLLGGGGLQEQYKRKLGGRQSKLVCLQLVRRRPMAMALRARDALAAAGRRAARALRQEG